MFSGSETAFISANRLKLMVQPRVKNGQLSAILSDEERFLTTTLVGNNVVMVACSSLAVLIFAPYIPNSLLVIFTTMFLLIFGEILPKTFAQQIPNRLVRFTPILMVLFYFLFYPLVKLAEVAAELLVQLFHADRESVTRFFKKSDLPLLIRKYSSIKFNERQLVARAVKISQKRLYDLMQPRTEITAVEIDTPKDKVGAIFHQTGLSRIPVYRGDLDHIVGFVYVLDLLTGDEISSRKVIRPAYFLPENTKAIVALNQMRKKGKSSAIVVDEHGGTAGLVTIEDLVEQLFGEIRDEFDYDQQHAQLVDEKTIIAAGRAEIDELEEMLHLSLPRGDYVTIAGLVESRLGHIPRAGEEIKLQHITIVVTQADERKIVQVRLIKNKKMQQ